MSFEEAKREEGKKNQLEGVLEGNHRFYYLQFLGSK